MRQPRNQQQAERDHSKRGEKEKRNLGIVDIFFKIAESNGQFCSIL